MLREALLHCSRGELLLPPIQQFLNLTRRALSYLNFPLQLSLTIPVFLQCLGVGHARLGVLDSLEHFLVLNVDLFSLFAGLNHVQ